jgi:DNA-binding response OmpR family regulator
MASNGEQALLGLKPAQPIVIELDLCLPDRARFTLARLIRSHSDVPILILSARSGSAEKVLGFEIGADDYLTKPFEPDQGRALSREQIFEQVWGYDIEFSRNTLDVMVYRLRGKITAAGGPDAIQTLRGFAYRFGEAEART